MSKVLEHAYQDLRNEKINVLADGTLEVLNAVIFWPNFSGKPGKFDPKGAAVGKRTFNLAILPEAVEDFKRQGWNVKEKDIPEITDDDGNPVKLSFVNVKCNIDGPVPPTVTLFVDYKGKKTRRPLVGDQIGELDSVDFESADCIINPYANRNYEGRVTGYLRKLNVVMEKQEEFGGKYDDWGDDDVLPFDNN